MEGIPDNFDEAAVLDIDPLPTMIFRGCSSCSRTLALPPAKRAVHGGHERMYDLLEHEVSPAVSSR
jgi:hypothetical protein